MSSGLLRVDYTSFTLQLLAMGHFYFPPPRLQNHMESQLSMLLPTLYYATSLKILSV